MVPNSPFPHPPSQGNPGPNCAPICPVCFTPSQSSGHYKTGCPRRRSCVWGFKFHFNRDQTDEQTVSPPHFQIKATAGAPPSIYRVGLGFDFLLTFSASPMRYHTHANHAPHPKNSPPTRCLVLPNRRFLAARPIRRSRLERQLRLLLHRRPLPHLRPSSPQLHSAARNRLRP
jgi:hypothetical protein